MKKIVSKSRTITKSKVLLKIHFSKKFFKNINDIRQGFNYNFIKLIETNNSFVGVLYECVNINQKRKIKNENGKSFIQYFTEKEKIIGKNEIINENKYVRLFYGDVQNVKEIFRFIKENNDIESGEEFEL